MNLNDYLVIDVRYASNDEKREVNNKLKKQVGHYLPLEVMVIEAVSYFFVGAKVYFKDGVSYVSAPFTKKEIISHVNSFADSGLYSQEFENNYKIISYKKALSSKSVISKL